MTALPSLRLLPVTFVNYALATGFEFSNPPTKGDTNRLMVNATDDMYRELIALAKKVSPRDRWLRRSALLAIKRIDPHGTIQKGAA